MATSRNLAVTVQPNTSQTTAKTTIQKICKPERLEERGDNDGPIEDEKTYRPRPQLPEPFVVKRSLSHLIKDLETGKIDIGPEYQREVVWTADRMTGLINSLMGIENFYIPPIVLNRKTQHTVNNDSPRESLVCVDGKQRLSSIRAFVQGMIPCHDHRGEKWWFRDALQAKRKRVLSEETQRMFLRKDFVSCEFKNLSAEQEEDLFARVQMGVQLSIAEKMRASTGPWQELARLFVEDFPTIYSLMKDRARAKDFQLTLSCFSQIVEVMHPGAADGTPTLKSNHNALPKLLGNKGAVDDGIKSHLASVWNTLKDMIAMDPDTFTNSSKYLGGVQTFAPVEMVAVTVLISMYSATRNNQLLLGDIKAMRTAFRRKFVDLRLNALVWKFTWEFLDSLEAIRGAVDGSTVLRKATQPLVPVATVATIQRPIAPWTQTAPMQQDVGKAKPLGNRPPRQTSAMEQEQGQTAATTVIHSPKRRRTESGPSISASSSATLPSRSDAIVPNHGHTPNNIPAHRPGPSTGALLPTLDILGRNENGQPRHLQNVNGYALPPINGQGTYLYDPRLQFDLASSSRLQNRPKPNMSQDTERPLKMVPSDFAPKITPTDLHISSPASSARQGPLRTWLGPFAPMHTEQEWGGIVASPSASSPRSFPLASNTQKRPRRASPSKRPAASHGVAVQTTWAHNGEIVDLTSETEHERQELLTSFKAHPQSTHSSLPPKQSPINVGDARLSVPLPNTIGKDTHSFSRK